MPTAWISSKNQSWNVYRIGICLQSTHFYNGNYLKKWTWILNHLTWKKYTVTFLVALSGMLFWNNSLNITTVLHRWCLRHVTLPTCEFWNNVFKGVTKSLRYYEYVTYLWRVLSLMSVTKKQLYQWTCFLHTFEIMFSYHESHITVNHWNHTLWLDAIKTMKELNAL